MIDAQHAPHTGIARRDFIVAGDGAGAFAAGLAGALTALAQGGSAPPAALVASKPGNILVERRGSVLLIGIDWPEAHNRFDAPMLIGLGRRGLLLRWSRRMVRLVTGG